MKDALEKFFVETNDFIIDIAIALIVIGVGFKIVSLFERSLKKPRRFNKMDPTAKGFIVSFIVIALKILVLVVALQILGIPTASIITVIGSCAVAIGLALQGGLSNIAGGIMILLFKPFKVGDFIVSGDKEGTVKLISIFYTTIVTPDNKIVQLPNGALSNSNITNVTGNEERRIDLKFYVDYKSDIKKVKKVIEDVVKSNDKTIFDERTVIRLFEHSESSLVFVLKVFVKTSDYWDTYYDLMESVKEAFDKNGISIPFNQLDVHVIK